MLFSVKFSLLKFQFIEGSVTLLFNLYSRGHRYFSIKIYFDLMQVSKYYGPNSYVCPYY